MVVLPFLEMRTCSVTATGFGDTSHFVQLQVATGSDLGSQLVFDNLDTATYRAFKLYFALLPNGTARRLLLLS